MFDWLKRLFGIAKAEANSALDKFEDPVKMTEQGIKDLKEDLKKSLQGLAEVKSMSIKSKKELEAISQTASEYENKAILLLEKAESGELDPAEADRLASQALEKKEQLEGRIATTQKNVKYYDEMVAKMDGNVQKLKSQVSEWENELKTLKARSTVSKATEKLNKQLSQVDSNDTLARLERMKEKVAEQESMAESYSEIASLETSVDSEINKALGSSATTNNDALLKLKSKIKSGSTGNASKSTGTSSENTANSSEPSQGPGASTGSNSELDALKEKLKNAKNEDGKN